MAKELYIGIDKNDVNKRLVNTVCRFKDDPVYVLGSREHVLELYEMTTGRRFKQDYRVPEFDYRSPPLGYINVENRAFYLTRLPSRGNQRQGLCHSTVWCSDPGFRAQDYISSKELRLCILGQHPSLTNAVEMLENEYESVAISRHVAINKLATSTLGLHYRGRLVGTRERGQWRLLDSGDSSIIEPLIRKAGVPL